MTLFSARLAAGLLSAIWQGSVLVVVSACCLRLLPGISAARRSAIWIAVFSVVIALHFVPAAGVPANSHEVHAAPAWGLSVVAAWVLCSLFRAFQILLSIARLREVSGRATPVEVQTWLPEIGRRFAVCTSADIDRPCVLGFFRPRVLLPVGLATKLSTEELRQVLLHEAEHLRRSDDWTNLLQKLALVAFPLNPVLLWVERRLCLERELACDDRVLSVTGRRKAYATCLTQLAEHTMAGRGLALALAAWERRRQLTWRIERILRRPEAMMGPVASRVMTVGLIFAVWAGSAALAHLPQLISFEPVSLAAGKEQARFSPTEHGTDLPPEAMFVQASLTAREPQGPPAIRKARQRSVHHVAVPRRMTDTFEKRLPHHQIVPLLTSLEAPADQEAQPFFVPTLLRVPVAYAAFATPNGWIVFEL